MPTAVQFRRGSTAQHSTFTGAVGEVTVDTDKKVVVVHDGTTVGGTPLATASSVQTASSLATSASSTANAALPRTGGVMTGNVTFTDSQRFPTVVANSLSNASYTLSATDAGCAVIATTTVVAPAFILSTGHAVSIFNNSSASISITAGSNLTLYQAGTANQGNRTLAQRGLATIYYINSSTAVVSGAGLS